MRSTILEKLGQRKEETGRHHFVRSWMNHFLFDQGVCLPHTV